MVVVQCNQCSGNVQHHQCGIHALFATPAAASPARPVIPPVVSLQADPPAPLLHCPEMTARAQLICRPNSHPFQERSLTLDQPVKIGRSVARVRPAPNNSIFDCKVLSRNHALLWYDNGKFYLQDTKSSNGTFVNNQRLSKGSEESPPREVCSGDIVQFGVDVMENSRKVTHGCIVATLKLYLPDGKEAKASPTTGVTSGSGSGAGNVPLQDLYQLNQYLQEAMQREQMLENKLAMIQRLVKSTKEAAESGWKSMIEEDRLLTRIEILESQLQAKAFPEDKSKEEVRLLQEDKEKYQSTAKESLLRMLQEKMGAAKKLQEVEKALSNTEDECVGLKEMCDHNQEELQEIGTKYGDEQKRVEELVRELQEAKERHKEEMDRMEQERKELQYQLQDRGKGGGPAGESGGDSEGGSAGPAPAEEEEDDDENSGDSKVRVKIQDLQEKDDDNDKMDNDVEQDLVSQLQERVRCLEAQLQEKTEKAHPVLEDDGDESETGSESSSSSVLVANGTLVRPAKDKDDIQRLQGEVSRLQEANRREEEKRRQAETQNERLSSELDSATANIRQSFDEANQLKRQLQGCQEKLRLKEEGVGRDMQDQEKHLQEQFRQKEAELRRQLEEEKLRFKASLAEADALRRQLQSGARRSSSSQRNAPPVDADLLRLADRLQETEDQLVTLKEKYASCNLEKTKLSGDLRQMQEDLRNTIGRSRRAIVWFVVPLAVLFLAILIAFHPST